MASRHSIRVVSWKPPAIRASRSPEPECEYRTSSSSSASCTTLASVSSACASRFWRYRGAVGEEQCLHGGREAGAVFGRIRRPLGSVCGLQRDIRQGLRRAPALRYGWGRSSPPDPPRSGGGGPVPGSRGMRLPGSHVHVAFNHLEEQSSKSCSNRAAPPSRCVGSGPPWKSGAREAVPGGATSPGRRPAEKPRPPRRGPPAAGFRSRRLPPRRGPRRPPRVRGWAV